MNSYLMNYIKCIIDKMELDWQKDLWIFHKSFAIVILCLGYGKYDFKIIEKERQEG